MRRRGERQGVSGKGAGAIADAPARWCVENYGLLLRLHAAQDHLEGGLDDHLPGGGVNIASAITRQQQHAITELYCAEIGGLVLDDDAELCRRAATCGLEFLD